MDTSWPRLIGITGPAGSGKDTLANYLHEYYGYNKYSLALPIKVALGAMFGFRAEQWEDREWKETELSDIGVSPRRLAQTLGTEWGRWLNEDMWVHLADRQWKILNESNTSTFGPLPRMVVSDVRFPNEAEWILDNQGLVIRINRETYYSVEEHKSEAGVPGYLINIQILNEEDRPLKMLADLEHLLSVPIYRKL